MINSCNEVIKEHNYHGEVNVAGVELHVDLLVDQSLGLGVVVLADDGKRHLEVFILFFLFKNKNRIRLSENKLRESRSVR